MEIELTQRTIDAIAYRTAVIIMQKLKKVQKDSQNLPKMVSTREAAAILGITPGRMRQIAERFPHIKQGEHKQGKLLFVRDVLLENY